METIIIYKNNNKTSSRTEGQMLPAGAIPIAIAEVKHPYKKQLDILKWLWIVGYEDKQSILEQLGQYVYCETELLEIELEVVK